MAPTLRTARLHRAAFCLAVLAAGCPAPSTRTGQNARTIPRGPRMTLRAGDDRSTARLTLEVDPRDRPVGPPTLHAFTFTIEEHTDAPEGDHARVRVRFVEVVGKSGEPALSDRLALALDDLKITFVRTDRGAAGDLKIEGLREPLSEATARAIAYTLFGTGQGARLPDHDVDPQDDWSVTTDANLLGLTVHERHFHTLLAQRGAMIELREKGHVEGITTLPSGTRRKIDGDTFTEETLDLDRGVVQSGEYEWALAVQDDPIPPREVDGVGRTRVRAVRGLAAQPKRAR